MNELTNNEIVAILLEKFRQSSFKILCIDCDDILFSSTNDQFGISWDVKTLRLEVYLDGYQIAWFNITNEIEHFHELILELKNIVKQDKLIVKEIESAYTKYILFERYEEAKLLTAFLNLVND